MNQNQNLLNFALEKLEGGFVSDAEGKRKV
jgi:hypothetical protein